MIKLPQKGIWSQLNLSDKFGDLWSSYNLDIGSNLGSLEISPRMILNKNSSSLTNLGVPCAARFFTTSTGPGIYIIAGARLFNNHAATAGGPNTDFAETSGTVTTLNSDISDIEEFNNLLYISGATTNLYTIDNAGTIATLSSKVANSSGLHAMAYFRPQNKLYYVDDNAAGIGCIDTSNSPATLGQQYTLNDLVTGSATYNGEAISWIKANADYLWIGTISYTGKKSKVYYWNGSTANTPDGYYIVDANGTLACVMFDDVPVVFDTRGRLLQLNGGTFKEIARLPFENEPPVSNFGNATTRLCHYNGIDIVDGKINVLVNTALYNTNATNKENVPSGVWEYDPASNSFYHKTSLGLSTSVGTITDYGQQKLSAIGMLKEIDCPSSTITRGSINGKFLAGATYYSDATTTLKGIFYDDTKDTLQKSGSFITSKIFSTNITEIWQKMFVRFKKLSNATDKIVVKYRTNEEASSEATITWSNDGTIFSTTQTGLVVGDEVEIIQGIGSGICGHITAVEDAGGGSYNITIDETAVGISVGTTAKARFQSWTKVLSFSNTSQEYFEAPCPAESLWIQFKVWVLVTGSHEINDLFIISVPHQKL